MSKKCRAYSESKLGLEPADNRKAFYAGWDAAIKYVLTNDISQECVDETAKDRHEFEQPDLARVGEVGVWGHKREWVGLSDEEVHDAFNFVEFIKQISFDRDRPEWCENFAAYLEAKLKEKNQ